MISGGLHMKKCSFIPFFAAVLTGLSAVAVTAASEPAAVIAEARYSVSGTTPEGIEYYHDDAAGSEVTIYGYSGTSTTVVIPSEIAGRKVTTIQEKAFSPSLHGSHQPANITSVTIPNTVKTIGFRAFFKVPLKKLSVPAGVQFVGEDAFANCDSLTEVKIYGKTTLDKWAFDGCHKLKKVDIKDSTVMKDEAFINCSALQSVNIAGGCSFGQDVFTNCSSLQTVNGHSAVKYSTTGSGLKQPYFNSNSAVRDFVRYTFTQCRNVGFLHKFCTEYCKYIVASETDPWMSDAIIARQLHDWLIRSCDYDPRENTDHPTHYRENHSAYSVFVSCALDGHGMTVCEGFSKAYTMLLKTAGIESYVLLGISRETGKTNHSWNFVRIGDRYYQCDVTWDNSRYDRGNSVSFGTNYVHFMKNNYDMNRLHSSNQIPKYFNPTVLSYGKDEHPLLVYDFEKGSEILQENINIMYSSMVDFNCDGIWDDDYDLDGIGGNADYWDDMLARQQLAGTIYGYDVDINNKLSSLVYRRHLECVVHSMGY